MFWEIKPCSSLPCKDLKGHKVSFACWAFTAISWSNIRRPWMSVHLRAVSPRYLKGQAILYCLSLRIAHLMNLDFAITESQGESSQMASWHRLCCPREHRSWPCSHPQLMPYLHYIFFPNGAPIKVVLRGEEHLWAFISHRRSSMICTVMILPGILSSGREAEKAFKNWCLKHLGEMWLLFLKCF